MATATEVTPEGRKVLRGLGKVGPEIERHKRELDKLYVKANRLYVEGDVAGLRRTDMARAMGAPEDKVASVAENIRQVIKGR